MSDITLSLGGKWKAETAERERQAQVIAHLTNQLEGLRAAYAEDLEQVAKHKQLLVKLQTDLDKAEIERDEWKNAYNGVVNKRIERDHLVEDMLSQLKTLEVTTRNEEIRASDADKRSSLLQKEKELVMDKLEKTRAELDEVYSKLAVANDQVATLTDNNQNLNQALQSTTRSRDTKEKQVVSLLKEKGKLFRLVTDLRSTIKVAGGSLSSREQASDEPAAASENATPSHSLPTSARSARSRSRHSAVNGVKNMIDQTLSGIIDRPKWQAHSRNGSLPSASGAADDSPSKSHSRKASNFSSSTTTAWTDETKENSSSVFTPRSVTNESASHTGSARKPKSKFSLEDTSDEEEENNASSHGIHSASTGGPMSPESQRADLAKKGLILRLKKQIELLEEKNKELEKISSLVRSENAQLLVRFRGAHEKRVGMEKKLKQTEKQLDSLRASNGSDAHLVGQEQQGHQEEQAQIFSSSTNSNHHHHHHHHHHAHPAHHASAPVEEHSYVYDQPSSLRKQQQQQAAMFSKQATPQQSSRWK